VTTNGSPGRLHAVVAIVGVDGAGKTTQAHLLAAWLAAAGYAADYWQNAGGRRWFGRLAQFFGRPDAQALLGVGGMLFVESDHEDLGYLAAADAAYRSLPESARFVVIDADRDLAAVQRDLRLAVAARLGLPGADVGPLVVP
jgi:thymidylate kinase